MFNYLKTTFKPWIVYIGQFVGGKMEGQGQVKFENGDIFIGRFLNGLANGMGTYYRASTQKNILG